ncbi:MAG: putative transport system substrate-binding protein [Rhizobium sp.]|nr:putative transport system substrate-binding protein [Rhizobium sp.]
MSGVRQLRCALVLLAAILLPGTAEAQQEGRLSRVGLVSLHSEELAVHVDGIRQELQKLGYSESRVKIDAHFTNGDKARAQEILKSFVESRMDVIVAWTTPTVQLAREATKTVPIVMIASDPVASGLVSSLSRPGGNITGVSMSGPDLAGKRLELLREIKPGIGTIAFLGYAPAPGAAAFVRESQVNADKIGLKVLVRLVQRVEDVNAELFAALKSDGAEAVVVQPFFTGHAAEISALGLSAGLPVISDYQSFAQAGGFASLGVDLGAQVKRTAYFIDRILKGARPADLPVEQPTKFELVFNARTAKTLGLALTPNLLARADEVIE